MVVGGALWWNQEGEQEVLAGLGTDWLWRVGGMNGLSDQPLPGQSLVLICLVSLTPKGCPTRYRQLGALAWHWLSGL